MTRFRNSREGEAAKTYGERPCDGCKTPFVAKAENAKYCHSAQCRRDRRKAGDSDAAKARKAARTARSSDEDRALRLHNAGYLLTEIGIKLGISASQAGHYVRRAKGDS